MGALPRCAKVTRDGGRVIVKPKPTGKPRYSRFLHQLDTDLPIVPKQSTGFMKALERSLLKVFTLAKVQIVLSASSFYR